jgi:magnesium transporter
MNLSRIITNPERFIQPVPQEVLNEESDEPELLLEAHLQHALSEVNALELLKGNISNTEELVTLRMDTIRNRLLYINTVVSVISLCVATASLVGSIFGMNLINHLEEDKNAFVEVVLGTVIGIVLLLIAILAFIARSGVMPKQREQAQYSQPLR